MKYMYLFLAIGLLTGSNLISAKTEAKKKTHIIHKKEKKDKKPEAKSAKVQKSHRISHKAKKSPYKNVTKRAATPVEKVAPVAAPTTSSSAPVATAPVATEPSALQKVGNWLGLGTAGTAASATAKSYLGHHRVAGYHIGPRNWHHNFPSWWADRGWTSADIDGVWYFAGHPIEWWASKPEYESYYKNVIRHEYLKAHPEIR